MYHPYHFFLCSCAKHHHTLAMQSKWYVLLWLFITVYHLIRWLWAIGHQHEGLNRQRAVQKLTHVKLPLHSDSTPNNITYNVNYCRFILIGFVMDCSAQQLNRYSWWAMNFISEKVPFLYLLEHGNLLKWMNGSMDCNTFFFVCVCIKKKLFAVNNTM